jgi:tetraacyldisaccharide 4'-kinase
MNFLRKIAFPFSLLYRMITSLRNFLYNKNILKSNKFKTPTIIVGNLSVGGTGKTPQIEYLIRLLQNDYKVAVLSRGYKRKSKGFVMADESVNAETIGDEPYQYFQKFPTIIVCVDADRTNGIKQLEKMQNPPDIILLDDAFQHRKVQGGLNILLTTYKKLYVDDCVLPTGNLREKSSGSKRAHVIVVTKCPENIKLAEQQKIIEQLAPNESQQVFFTTITYETDLKGFEKRNVSDLKQKEVLLITGIANPTPLVNFLKTQQVSFTYLKYPDHHKFTQKDIVEIQARFNNLPSNNKLVLTTEKDYVRIFDKIKNVYYISIQTTFINQKNDFDKRIKDYVGKSSRNG